MKRLKSARILKRFVILFNPMLELTLFLPVKDEDTGSDNYNVIPSSPLKSRHVAKPKKKRGDERALIEQSRLTESKVGDLFASATSDTSKRKLVNQDGQPQYQLVFKFSHLSSF
jgi:hypothetical protein